jgi:hypothetical protein
MIIGNLNKNILKQKIFKRGEKVVNKNMFNKVICFVIALMMFMPALPGNLAMASDGISWPNPGAINLTKEAEPVTETENQWEITLTIEGKNIQKTSKVVLVIDKSGSMGSGSKLANTKLAAKEFVDKLLLQDKSTEIAIVTFDASPHTIKNFIGYGNAGEGKTELKNAIDGISASGGTNIQAGIHRAQELLDGVTADNKVIVLLGDGEPTHSYRVTGVTGITLTGHTGWPFNNPVIEYNNPQITAVNYNERVGSGSSYSLTSSYRYQIPCQTHGTHSTNFPANNGIPTIYEAGVSKEKGTDIYSIALNAGSNGQSVLNQSQNKGYYQLNSSDLSGLQGVFQQIAGSIVNAATNGTVTDPMGDMFDLITSIDDIYVSQGEILSVGAEHPHLITWYVGDVLEGVPAIMKYTVQIKAEADADTMYPTNDETTFEYTDAYGEETSKEFDIPEASIGGGSILYKGYLVDEDGNPISGDGEIVDRPDLAYRLYDKSLSDTPLPYTTYDVMPDEMEEYEYVKYVLNGDEGTEVPVSVLLQASKPTETVWFGYILKSQDDDTLPYTVEYYKDGIKFKTISGEVPVSNPEVQAEDVPSHMPDGYIPGPGSSQFPFTVSPDNNVIRIYYINESPEPEFKDNVIIVKHYTKTGSAAKVLVKTDDPIPVTTSATIYGETYRNSSLEVNRYEFDSSTPEFIEVYARTATESAIKFTFELLYYRDSTGGGGTPSGPGGGGTPTTIIEDPEIPLAELEKEDHFAYIIGYPEGDIRPMNNITREEVAMIFYRLLTDESRDALLTDANPFTDVEAGRWSNRAISTLFNADIISGYPDGTFRPSAPITRAEFATIAAKFDDLDLGSASKFTDIVGHWAEDYITSSENKGWIKGYPDMTFKPQQDITRAEAMTLINNVLERAVPAENIHPDAIFWPDISEDDWYYEAVMEATNSHDYTIEEDGDELWTGMKANKVWP